MNTIQLRTISLHELIQAVNDFPGGNARDLAERLRIPPERISGRLSQLSKKGRVKSMRLDGYVRYYPLEHLLTADPRADNLTVHVAGKPLVITRLTAEDLARREREKWAGKYIELLNVLEDLSPGDAIAVPKVGISADGLRSRVRQWFRGRRVFDTQKTDTELIIICKERTDEPTDRH